VIVAACPGPDELGQYLAGALPPADEESVAGHIEVCLACQSLLDGLVAADLPFEPLPSSQNESLFVRQLQSLDVAFITSSRSAPTDCSSTELPSIPNYEVLAELGRGGTGIVYRARHLTLGREVAIKMLLTPALQSESDTQRFHFEAETVAQLHHPNIVQLFEIGEIAGQPFLVFEYVAGGTLQQKLAGRPQPPREAAALVEVLARAVHAAHAQHIIHRDLKPANVLLADAPSSRYGFPKLTDFGLAKQLDAHSAGLTRSLSGTPAYMAPEQVTGAQPGQDRHVTPATDVYALGVILYEMLVGRPPFLNADWMATLLQVERNEPVSPRALQPSTPRDLETVCLKCLEKEPARRYAAAEDLADDIGRYLKGQPTAARPLSRAGRVAKLVRRYPLVSGLIGVVIITLVAGFFSALLLWQRAVSARNELQNALGEVQVQHSQAELSLYFGRIAQSVLLWEAGDSEQARELLASCEPGPGQADLRGWEWRYLEHMFHPEVNVRRFPFWVNDLALLPAAPGQPDELAAAVGKPQWNLAYRPVPEDGLAGFVRFDDSTPFMNSSAPLPGGCLSVAVQADGPLIAWGTSSGHVVVMDRHSGRHVRTIALKSSVSCLRFMAGGDRLISSHVDGALRVLNPVTGEQVLKLNVCTGAQCVFAVNPEGTQLACGGTAGKLQFFELPSWKPIGDLVPFRSQVTSLAFSPDGTTLLSGGLDGTIVAWDVDTHRENRRLEDHSGAIYSIAFRPDGKMFASGGADRVVRLWDVGLTKPVLLFRGHFATVRSLVFSRDGRRLASGSQDNTLRVWNTSVDPRGLVLPFHHRLNAIAFDETQSVLTIRADHTDGRKNGGNIDGGIKAWSLPTGSEVSEFAAPRHGRAPYPIRYADFLNRGRTLAAVLSADPRALMFIDAATGQRLDRAIPARAPIQTLAADPSGRWLLWAESEGGNETLIRRWDEQTQHEDEPIRLNVRRIHSLAFDPGQGRIAAVVDLPAPAPESSLWIVDAAGREPPHELCRASTMSGGLTFNTRGNLLAAAVDEKILVFRTDTWELLHRIPSLVYVTSVAFSADDRRLAAVGYDSVVILADPATGTRILQLGSLRPNRPDDMACNARIAFSSDGNWLASTNWDGSLSVRNGSPMETNRDRSAEK
jgi:eukaryotic-like serine/threonine-protein kinase